MAEKRAEEFKKPKDLRKKLKKKVPTSAATSGGISGNTSGMLSGNTSGMLSGTARSTGRFHTESGGSIPDISGIHDSKDDIDRAQQKIEGQDNEPKGNEKDEEDGGNIKLCAHCGEQVVGNRYLEHVKSCLQKYRYRLQKRVEQQEQQNKGLSRSNF